MKINWYGIWFDICLGTQCTELFGHLKMRQKKAMGLHITHTHISTVEGKKLAEDA